MFHTKKELTSYEKKKPSLKLSRNVSVNTAEENEGGNTRFNQLYESYLT